jgi:signal transduction histidine kinase
MVAGVAHEMRTPLAILKARLHAIEDGVIAPAMGEADRLLRQVEHLIHIVDDLGALAQADAGELRLDPEPLDPGDLLRTIVSDLAATAEGRGMRFVERYRPARMIGDRVRLTQLFTNLLTNALKHGPDGSEIAVAASAVDGGLRVVIADEGPGFDPADARRLFAPFWRATADRRARLPGSGIGLSLAATLAEAHGGRIVARNREDRSGARFSVWLPLARGDDPVSKKGDIGWTPWF